VYVSVVLDVMLFKVLIVVNAEFIEEISPGKIQIEVGLIEIKYAIVEGKIELLTGIRYTDSAVAEGGIQFVMSRPTRDHRNFSSLRQAQSALSTHGRWD
jgi:hypothetical protein